MRLAVAISPSATSPADTEPRNIVARPVDSAIVAARAPCRVKCSVVMNVTAAERGSKRPTAAPVMVFASPAIPISSLPRASVRSACLGLQPASVIWLLSAPDGSVPGGDHELGFRPAGGQGAGSRYGEADADT